MLCINLQANALWIWQWVCDNQITNRIGEAL